MTSSRLISNRKCSNIIFYYIIIIAIIIIITILLIILFKKEKFFDKKSDLKTLNDMNEKQKSDATISLNKFETSIKKLSDYLNNKNKYTNLEIMKQAYSVSVDNNFVLDKLSERGQIITFIQSNNLNPTNKDISKLLINLKPNFGLDNHELANYRAILYYNCLNNPQADDTSTCLSLPKQILDVCINLYNSYKIQITDFYSEIKEIILQK